ncbi:hypothetical protein D9M71_506870 [compost metagenome]
MGYHAGHAVDHTQGHQPFPGERLHVRPQRREVMRVADGQNRNPAFPGLGQQQRPRSGQGRLGKTIFRIGPHKPRGHILDLRLRAAIDPAAGQR